MNKPPAATFKSGLGHRSAVAFSWAVFSSLFKVVLTVLIQAVLARLLEPREFGLFALALLVVGIAGYFADAGLATSLVQQRQVGENDIRFVFTLNLITALAIGALLMGFAGSIASTFDKPEVKPTLQWLAPIFVVNAIASVSVSLLRRDLDYRSIQIANLVGYALGFGVVGIAAAAVFGTVQSLVAAYLCQAVLTLILLYRKTRHSIGFTLETIDRSVFLGFGANILVTNLVNWAASSLDRLIVSRLFSSATLGYYSASFNLIYSPVGALYASLQSTVFSSVARMQDELLRMRAAYLLLLRTVTLAFLPMFIGLYFYSGPLVLAIYGEQWVAAAPIAGPFCLMAPFVMIWACSTPVLWNTGRNSLEWKVQLPFLALTVLVIVPAASSSIVAVAWAASGIYMTRTILMMGLACRALGISFIQVFAAVWPGIWIAAIVCVVAQACALQLQANVIPVALQVVLGALVVLATIVTCLLSVPAVLPEVVRGYIGNLIPLAPQLLRPLLNRLNRTP